MKTAWLVIASLCLLHLAALLGVVGWAVATQRVDRERVAAAVALFRQPVGEEQDADAAVDEQVEADAEETISRAERLVQAAGTESIAERLESNQRRNEMTLRQLERTRQEVQSLTRNLQLAQRRLEEQRAELEAEREAFEARLQDVEARLDDEGFQRAVALLESLPPRQAKEMFVEMIAGSGREEVVSYLMAMQPRRASGVLREFKTADEVRQAVELTEMLRARGSRVVADLEDAG